MKFSNIFIEKIKTNCFTVVTENNNCLLLEGIEKRILGTRKVAVYNPSNINTATRDHYHVFADKKKNNQLYAINRDGTPHDGSRAQLSKREIDFFNSQDFLVPADGLLEFIDLLPSIKYIYIDVPTHILLIENTYVK